MNVKSVLQNPPYASRGVAGPSPVVTWPLPDGDRDPAAPRQGVAAPSQTALRHR